MILSDTVFQVAEIDVQQRFNNQLLAEMRSLFPDAYVHIPESDAMHSVAQMRSACNALEIYSQQGIFTYFSLHHLLGESFMQSRVFLDYMRSADGMGDHAIDQFLDQITHKMNR